MQCLVAIKQVIDPYVTIRVKSDQSGVETANLKLAINPFDEIAIEEAVRQKEAGKINKITALTIGPATSQDILRQAIARGVDDAILIESTQDYSPLCIAKIIQHIVIQQQIDLVLMGKQAIDNDCNQTGQMLAGLLNWSQGTFVSKLTINQDHILVTREVDGGLESLRLTIPAVITTDLRLNQPRYISLPNIMQAKNKPLTILKSSELGLNLTNTVRTVKVTAPPTRTNGLILNSVEELIDKLKNEAKVI